MLHCPTCGRHYADDLRTCPEDGAALQADPTIALGIPPKDPLIGRTFDGKYRLDERLGEGGMGTVYRATHLLIDRPVAVKVLNPRWVEDEAAQERFRREARAAGRLQHTNAVAVTDFGRTEDNYVYIVMELLEGRSLREVLAREAPLDAARAVSMMLQISAAVAAAHEEGIIHRDLKPGNIFIVQRKHAPPVVKVLDFGIAKVATDAADESDPVTLTQLGVMIGTPRYMSPEQCDGVKLTPASDVYSLGIILYEMLTGSTPFNGTTPLAIALKQSSETPRAPRELVPTIPLPLQKVVLHALAKKPEDRPADAGEFRHELYTTAAQLGLEHSGSFITPNLETLRSAGTESPSGRLVLDMDRLRQQRAATSAETNLTPASTTAKEQLVHTNGAPRQQSQAPAPRKKPAIIRLRIPLERRQAWSKWLRQPLVLIGVSLTSLFLAVVIFAVVATRSTNESAGQVPAPVSPTPAPATPSPMPTESPEEERNGKPDERETRKQPGNNNAKKSRRGERQQQKKKSPSKVRSIVNKVKGIFKNPF